MPAEASIQYPCSGNQGESSGSSPRPVWLERPFSRTRATHPPPIVSTSSPHILAFCFIFATARQMG